MIRASFAALLCVLGTAARSAWAEDRLPPQIVHEPCGFYKRGQPFEIQARFLDESKLFDPKVIYRGRNETFWKNSPFIKQSTSEDFSATVKAKDLTGTLEYFIEVFDEWGNGPARYGSPEAPVLVEPSRDPPACRQIPVIENQVQITSASTSAASAAPNTAPGSNAAAAGGTPAKTDTIHAIAPKQAAATPLTAPVPPPPQGTCSRANRPIFCSPWFWGVVGVVVAAGAGTGIYFAVAGGSGNKTIDSVTLNVKGPSPVTSLQAQGAHR